MFWMFLLGCQPDAPSSPEKATTPAAPSAKQQKVVVYSGRGESMVGKLFEQAEKELGFPLEVQYGSTPNMVTRMLTEQNQSPADVIFAQDSGHLGALANRDMLAKLPDALLQSVEQHFRDDAGRWIGTSGRLRVLVYDSAKISPDDLPKSLADLADPKWKSRLGWAPKNGSFQSHISALRHIWGEQETKTWLQKIQANDVKVFPKNSPQVKAVQKGSLDIGWVNHYYLHKLKKKDGTTKNFSFSNPNDAGNIMMLAGAGIRKGSKRQKNAEKLLSYLVSAKSQEYFTQNNFEYPTRPGIKPHPDVPPITPDKLAKLKQSHLADLGPTRKLLQDLNLQ